MNRLYTQILRLCALFFLLCAGAQSAQLGTEYQVIPRPQPAETGKVEVIEFFWYACPHCYAFEPTLSRWAAKLPKDVVFKRIPAVARDSWEPLARTYYALEAMGEVGRLHEAVFNAVHKDKIDLSVEKTQADWLSKQGVDVKRFTDIYHSFGIETKVRGSRQVFEKYAIEGVPAIIVDGRYYTAPSIKGGAERCVAVIDELIAKVKADRSAK
ncbi:MAG: thiol:disulfide interchange protein DsbA/DsbL [Rhodocyclaceae bacterium]|nr:thiol:disulfide interchange protein DsbA/DsbL [Rhodocyclaceae bacterium]MBX3668748.1 thiol:disulfide interchange protein DsbA/DsbL [Rhodocyclaceae bacterium]